ncbi:hypothetical protein C1D09_004100 [Mesorhizobium intechi]|uniref:MaoC/PaaZ C-terminal domain-containing protein n=1 Tax=Mesorhizobium intechi TaxID=537601 RepID=UPI000CB319A3|nr:MaoC/PaaZ C-terminal domain-containing protein [Mesorhizobium intechi]TSE13409.1 hypothetical protein C1D09_004100 [Mesorhizobium intechi]
MLSVSVKWESIQELVGRSFVSDWLMVAPDRLRWFDLAAYIDDNENSMSSALYPKGMIEGFHLLSLLDHLVNQALVVEDPDWSGWNYGFDSVRFVSMVTTDDHIRVRGNVVSIEPRGKRHLITINCSIEVKGREKPAMVAVWKVMWTLASEEV